jgi:hypothetical protein
MNAAFKTALAAYGSGLITHIGLFNGATEITGGSPAYARKAVTWTGSGAVRSPSANLVFDVPAGATVTNWRGFTALTGGTDYEGAALTSTAFSNQGTYTLLAASTNITVA